MTQTQHASLTRCAWADTQELFVPYHDEEWGVPVHDDRLLFEMLNLEGAQAGLSWLTILKKRDGYRRAFDNFDVKKIVRGETKQAALLADAGIVRHRRKIAAVITNAEATPTTCYAFMQAVGLVDDHEPTCFRFGAG